MLSLLFWHDHQSVCYVIQILAGLRTKTEKGDWWEWQQDVSIWIAFGLLFGQNCFTSSWATSVFLPHSPYLFYLFIHSLPQRLCSLHLPLPIFHSLPAVPPLGLMNDLAGDGSYGCGGASRARRGEETLFLSPPSYYSHSPGYTLPRSPARNRMVPAYWIIC